MDERERRVKLEKLASLDDIYIKVMYYRFLDKSVSDIKGTLEITNEKTVWTRFTRIYEKLGITGTDKEGQLIREYSPILLEFIKSEQDLKNWGHIRAAMFREIEVLGAQVELESSPETSSLSQTESQEPKSEATQDVSGVPSTPSEDSSESPPSTETEQTSRNSSAEASESRQVVERDRDRQIRRSFRPWPVYAIPLLLFCVLCIAVLVFAWPRISIAPLNELLFPPTPTDTANPQSANTPADTLAPTENLIPSTLQTQTARPADLPTETAIPATPTSPLPTLTQAPTQTSVPTLFSDSFNTGINQEWGMAGDNFNAVEGKLTSLGTLHGIVGDSSWTDYVVELNLDHLFWSYIDSGLRILVRYQDDSNYMALAIKSVNGCDFRWLSVSAGEERVVVGSETRISGDHKQCLGFWRIEMDGNSYKVILNFEPRLQFFDDTFNSGGVGIFVNQERQQRTEVRLDEFKVLPLP